MTMGKYERLRRADIDEPEARLLAQLPAAQVDLICKAARQARRAGLARDRERRRYARSVRAKRWTDAGQVADGSRRMLGGLAGRAGNGDLEAGALLYRLIMNDGPQLLQLTIDGLRADTPERKGYSDKEIAEALGVTKMAIGERFGRRQGPSARPRPAKRAVLYDGTEYRVRKDSIPIPDLTAMTPADARAWLAAETYGTQTRAANGRRT